MTRRDLTSAKSGQVIVITALLVALVLLSTAIFVIETEKNVPKVSADENNSSAAYQLAAKDTLISALANVTAGGNPAVLAADFNQLETAITSFSYQSMLQMNFTCLNEVPYQSGVCVAWGTNGQGVSSAYVTVQIRSTGTTSSTNLNFAANVTSEISVSGSYLQRDDNSTIVNLTANLQNEEGPALAQTFSFYFADMSGGWVMVNSPSISDFGNGTYSIEFTAQTAQMSFPAQVSTVCLEQRGITVEANATCTNAG